MKDKDLEKIIIFLLYNIKGRKKKRDDWITIAKKCKEATDYLKSYRRLAEKLSVHPETIRSILKLLELPKEVKYIIKKRKIGMDAAQRIMGIKNPKDQIKAAEMISNLSSHKARDMIRYMQRTPNLSIKDYDGYRKKLTGSNKKIKNLHIIVIGLEDETFKRLKEISSNQKTSLSQVIVDMIKKSLKMRNTK